MSYDITVAQAMKHIPLKTIGRVTIDDKNPRKMSFGQFLDFCPTKTVETGESDGPEIRKGQKMYGYIEEFFIYHINGKQYQYHICRKYDYSDKTKKYTFVYPTKQTSDYVGGVTYTSQGRIYI